MRRIKTMRRLKTKRRLKPDARPRPVSVTLLREFSATLSTGQTLRLPAGTPGVVRRDLGSQARVEFRSKHVSLTPPTAPGCPAQRGDRITAVTAAVPKTLLKTT